MNNFRISLVEYLKNIPLLRAVRRQLKYGKSDVSRYVGSTYGHL